MRQPNTQAILLVAIGWLIAGCMKTADLVDAVLMSPVLVESFELPAIDRTTVYHAGQSLKTPDNQWDVLTGVVEHVNTKTTPDCAASDGVQAMHLTDGAILATTVTTTPKKDYTLTLHYAHHNKLEAAPRARVEVFGDIGVLMEAELDHSGIAFDSYRRYSGTFSADSTHTTMRVTSLTPGQYGITLDGIYVRLVPAPLPNPTPTPAAPLM